jgi:hypothetical protein
VPVVAVHEYLDIARREWRRTHEGIHASERDRSAMVASNIERRPDRVGDRQSTNHRHLIGAKAIHPDRQPRLATTLSHQHFDGLIVVHPVRSM